MNTTTETKPYINGSRREYRSAGRYRYTLISHRADCVYGKYMRQRTPADQPHAELPQCCRDKEVPRPLTAEAGGEGTGRRPG